jgi:ferredoxin--NADP+ reductase
VHGTGKFVEYPVQAVYRAIGYFGSELPEVPFDEKYGVIRNVGGRVVDANNQQIASLFATGWIKRGPVGLIGHTKSDATETIENLLADIEKLEDPETPNSEALLRKLSERGVKYTNWAGWQKLNTHEIALGAADTSHVERERVKVVDREEQVSIAKA